MGAITCHLQGSPLAQPGMAFRPVQQPYGFVFLSMLCVMVPDILAVMGDRTGSLRQSPLTLHAPHSLTLNMLRASQCHPVSTIGHEIIVKIVSHCHGFMCSWRRFASCTMSWMVS